MTLQRQLDRWQRAGVVDAPTAERIAAFEAARSRPWVLYVAGALGALAVVLGLVALVAANWEQLGRVPKLLGDLLLGGALAAALLRVDARGPAWVRESLILLMWGFVLASIGLVSQVYQLGGTTLAALVVWQLLTVLLATRGRSLVLALLWIASLHVTWGFLIAWLIEERAVSEGVAASLVLLPMTACLAASTIPFVRTARPRFAQAAAAVGWLSFGLGASVAPQAFYFGLADGAGQLAPALPVAIACCAVLVAIAPRLLHGYASQPGYRRAVAWLRSLPVLVLLVAVAGLLVPHGPLGLVAAILMIGIWVVIVLLAWQLGALRLLNFATAVIAVRLLVVYLEVFGTLLQTGLGLIGGGVLTLALAGLWYRQSRRFREDAAAGADR